MNQQHTNIWQKTESENQWLELRSKNLKSPNPRRIAYALRNITAQCYFIVELFSITKTRVLHQISDTSSNVAC